MREDESVSDTSSFVIEEEGIKVGKRDRTSDRPNREIEDDVRFKVLMSSLDRVCL